MYISETNMTIYQHLAVDPTMIYFQKPFSHIPLKTFSLRGYRNVATLSAPKPLFAVQMY